MLVRSRTPPYSPATDANSILFYETDHASNVHAAGAFSQLTDLSSNGRHATQATGSKQPARVAAGLNGLPIARFDGANDSMGIVPGLPATSLTTWTMLAVFVNGPTGTAKPLYDQAALGTNRLLPAFCGDVATTVSLLDAIWRNPGAAATAAAQVLCWEQVGTQLRVFRDGVQIGSTIVCLGTAMLPPSYEAAICASFPQTASFSQVDLCSVLLRSGGRNAGVLAAEAYFRAKWGTP